MKPARPRFLPRARPRKVRARAAILGDLIGDVLIWVGIVKPTLADLDAEYARLKRERDKHRSQHGKGAREAQRRLSARLHAHLERGRA